MTEQPMKPEFRSWKINGIIRIQAYCRRCGRMICQGKGQRRRVRRCTWCQQIIDWTGHKGR